MTHALNQPRDDLRLREHRSGDGTAVSTATATEGNLRGRLRVRTRAPLSIRALTTRRTAVHLIATSTEDPGTRGCPTREDCCHEPSRYSCYP